ncbi:MAG: hypothetical protein Q7U28_08200 [Aquabacterium sp.]|nr:hypothetical protein [Aquabacterium sp.]
MRSNCLFFAIALYWRRWRHGGIGRITWRKSHYGKFPHWLYASFVKRTGRERLISYVPLDPKLKTCPPPLFKGRVRWGDVQLKKEHHDATR